MDSCCFNYVWWNQFLGLGQDSEPCTYYCVIDQDPLSGAAAVEIVIDGTAYPMGGSALNNQAANNADIETNVLIACGLAATEAQYSIGGPTNTEQAYIFIKQTCTPNEFTWDLDTAVFQQMTCTESTKVADFNTSGRNNQTQFSHITVNGFEHAFVSSTFDQTATVEAEIQTELENVFGLDVTSVDVQSIGNTQVIITIVSNGEVESLRWDGATSGSALFT